MDDNELKNLYNKFEIENILSFNEFDIQEKLQENAYRILQFGDLLIKEKKKLDELNEARDIYIGNLYDNLRFNNDKNLTKVEIEKYYIPTDKKLHLINSKIRKIETRVRFFEIIVKSLEKQSWNMSVFSKNLKS